MYVFKEDVIDIQERGNGWDEMGVKTPHLFFGMREKKTIKNIWAQYESECISVSVCFLGQKNLMMNLRSSEGLFFFLDWL